MAAPLLPPADRALARPSRRVTAAAAALAALVVVGAVGLLEIRPPRPRPADAPAAQFSAGRAEEHLRVVAAEPHPAGSAANDRVREHLVGTLRGLGLATEVQDTVAPEAGQLSGAAGGATLARVRNVVAVLPGTDPTGRVFVVAHYDSVQLAPGGNDDGAGTSTILEVARAMTDGARPRNDVVFVLTDAEEACLCGASAFASSHPLAQGGGVVLNLEARGSTGPVIMFETSRDNAALVGAYGRAAPHPVGTSFAVEVYRLLPNDTDFTAFLAEDFVGLNSAYLDGGANYHTPQDTVGSVDLASIQHHGDNTLALVREFGSVDIAGLTADGDATYFPVPGGLVRYPGWLTWPLVLLAGAAVGLLAWLARRRGRTTWSKLGVGFELWAVPIVVAPVAAQLLWAGLTAIRPGYAELLDPYRPQWYRLAVLGLTATIVLAWYALIRRRIGPAALAISGLGWLVALGAVLAALAPGGSYLATLPALATAIGGIVALLVRPGSVWAVVAVTAGAAVGVLVLLPTVVLLFPALGMAMGGAAAVFTVLLGIAVLPVVDLLHPEAGGQRGLAALEARRAAAVPTLAAGLATLVFAGVGLAVDRFDADHPTQTHLMYALDADTGTARWLSREADPQPWTAGYVDGPASIADEFPALAAHELLAGPAQAAALPAPAVQTVSDTTTAGVRTLRVRLVPQRQVRLAALHVDQTTATVRSATVAGVPVPVEPTDDDRWSFGIVFHAPPPEGVEIELTLAATGQPVALRAADASDGLSGLPGFRPRPADVGIVGSHSSEMLMVARTYRLPPA
ncbi:M28 family peptidase [Polymorphospora sp. NPDC050346]|uniref:M28 family peptidase n=1 Tax=Polymorphospora sp. NPDC050346 TaxID=3155780 RepID=UPI0033E168E9